jgi:hypothetical protein
MAKEAHKVSGYTEAKIADINNANLIAFLAALPSDKVSIPSITLSLH